MINIILIITFCCLSTFSRGNNTSQLLVYFEISEKSTHNISFQFKAPTLVGESDTLPLIFAPIKADGNSERKYQQLICENDIIPGTYTHLKFSLSNISARAESAEVFPLALNEFEMLPLKIKALPGHSTLLFLIWNPPNDKFMNNKYAPDVKLNHARPYPASSLAIVTNTNSNNITLFESNSHKILNVIKVGSRPHGLAYMPSSQKLFVANKGTNNISVLNLPAEEVTRTIPLHYGDGPTRIRIFPPVPELFILNSESHSLSVLSADTYQQHYRINLEFEPDDFTIVKDQNLAYISGASDYLWIYDLYTRRLAKKIFIGGHLGAMALNPADDHLYISNKSKREITTLHLISHQVIARIKICDAAFDLVYNHSSRNIFASIPFCNQVSVIKPLQQIEMNSLHFDDEPGALAINPSNQKGYIAFPSRGFIQTNNINSFKKTGLVQVGQNPSEMLFVE